MSGVRDRYRVFMECAKQFATLSTCSRKQVGVVIATWDLTSIVSVGYNGNYRGGPNACDRPTDKANCGCLHAEDNALIKAPYGDPLVMFVTTLPCATCAKRIANSSVKKVVFDKHFNTPGRTEGLDILEAAGITVYQLEEA